jgi:hypothetical protein
MSQLDEFLLTAEPSMQRRRGNFNGIAHLRHVASDAMGCAAIRSRSNLQQPSFVPTAAQQLSDARIDDAWRKTKLEQFE